MGADFEVYVHVPFCLRRCGYCDFNTYTASDLGAGASRANYARMAAREMELVYDWQCAHGIAEPAASTVFFGGGTPTVLSPDDLVFLVGRIRTLWGIAPGAEITTEANPDTVDETAIDRLAAGWFTHLVRHAVAVPHVLRTLDHTHTPAHVTRGVRAAQAAGLDASVDLIYGAPGESLNDWRTSVRSALDLGVRHLSAYALTVEPTTAMGRRIAAGTLPKPDDDDEAAKYEIVDAMAQAAGLEWYEISNWAAPGTKAGTTWAIGAMWTGPASAPARTATTGCPPAATMAGEGAPYAHGTRCTHGAGGSRSTKGRCRSPTTSRSTRRPTSKRPSCSACACAKASTCRPCKRAPAPTSHQSSMH